MQKDTTTYRILAVDDDPDVHNTYHAILDSSAAEFDDELMALTQGMDLEVQEEENHFQLESAYSGQEGLQHVLDAIHEGNPYSVVFLDMRMPPGWDGLVTAEKIREADPTIRIILITAYMDYELSDIQQRIGNDFIFLHKPIDRDELLQLTTLFASQWERASQIIQPQKHQVGYSIPTKTVEEAPVTDQKHPMRIVLIDPMAAIRSLYEKLLLRNTHYDVACAANTDEALMLINRFSPDLCIISLSMNSQQMTLINSCLDATQHKLALLADDHNSPIPLSHAGGSEILYKNDPTEIFLQRIRAIEQKIQQQSNPVSSTVESTLPAGVEQALTKMIGHCDALLESSLDNQQRLHVEAIAVSARTQRLKLGS
ncbi:MAG: response regulator [Gammaproteobacteria bacterium]|jgi:CheY-like chemotaxis protein|nr:response regulator [Gammaproteobacteria bacterium]MBT3719186.1 response regulator [Gammaproteobacteria bacterium]MBT3845010.1 response regulator [Gammaproteobacteria bacterium]MBT3894278.1 response regulator [Gammaproteobacteria bacterium]MBT4302049.1 response regulator [Gammaproteobacteria bacterium]